MNPATEIRRYAAAAGIARMAMRLGASQDEYELRQAIELVHELEPKVIVELGCDRGGTLYAWRRLCSRVYGITWGSNADSGGAECLTYGAVVRHGDTHDPESLQWLMTELGYVGVLHRPDPVDVLVVDGDHHLEGIKQDLRMYAPLVRVGGLIMLHDVCPEIYPEVHVWRLWPELRGRYQTRQLGTRFGWGVIRVREGDDFRWA